MRNISDYLSRQKFMTLLLSIGVLTVFATSIVAARNNPQTTYEGYAGYSKNQCKDGGWESLGFKNQGQCVSFFASDGRANGPTE